MPEALGLEHIPLLTTMFQAVVLLFCPLAVSALLQYRHNFEKYPTLSECLIKIARDQVKTRKLVFISEDLSEDNNVQTIIKIKWERVVLSVNDVSSVSGLYVFLPDGNATVSYDKVLKIKHLDHNSFYVICSEDMHKIFSFFEVAWEYKIIDAIALYPSSRSNKISVYTYVPFGEWGCSNTDPVRINVYDPMKKSFESKNYVFSKSEKLFNLHKCPVKVTLKDTPSEAITKTEIEYNTMSLRLFHFLKTKMNFTPEVVLVDKEANTYAAAYYNFTSAAVLNIVQGESDIAVGRFTQLTDYHDDIIAPVQTGMDCFTWAVPLKAGKEPSVWTTSLFEFDFGTWILLITVFCITALILRLTLNFTNLNYSNPTLSLLGILLNISVNMKFKSTTLRVFFSHWILFCLVVVAAYSASLGSLVTVPPDSSNIKTTQELLEKDIQLTGDPKMYHILSASSDTSLQIKQVLEKFVILRPGEFNEIIYDIFVNRNKAVFYTKSKLIQEENRVRLEKQLGNVIHIVPLCLIGSHTAPLMMRKGSVLMDPVEKIVTRLLENGVLNYWTRLEEEEKANSDDSQMNIQKFTISQLRGALIVIICGHTISAIVFAYEVYSARVKTVSKKIKK